MKPYLFTSLFLALASLSAQAAVKPIVTYDFGRSGNVTYAQAPESIVSPNNGPSLSAVGKPVFYADAPADQAIRGEGSILFQQDTGYMAQANWPSPSGNRLVELWVNPQTLPSGNQWGSVVSDGQGDQGYELGICNGQWTITAKGKQTTIEVARPGEWVHLAIVVQQGRGEIYLNGAKKVSFEAPSTLSRHFTLATDQQQKRPGFIGMIHEVRVCTFDNGAFQANGDLSFSAKTVSPSSRQRLDQRKQLIQKLTSPGPHQEITATFPNQIRSEDWLISSNLPKCKLLVQPSSNQTSTQFQLTNGLISRTFYLGDNVACISYKNLSNGAEYIRAVKPETRIKINGTWYEVGGLKNQPEQSYLLEEWLPNMRSNDKAFQLVSVETASPIKRYDWKQKFNAQPVSWPPKGLRLIMRYVPTEQIPQLKDVKVAVHYEIYEGIPVIAKWVEVENSSETNLIINEIECEVLAVNQDQRDHMHVESDFSFALVNGDLRGSALMHFRGTPKPYQAGGSTTLWTVDPDYHTWATHNQAEDAFLGFQHRNMLLSRLPVGPDTVVNAKRPFKSFITFELLHDSDDRERQTLGHRRMYRTLAPQTTESLLTGGITSNNPEVLKQFIDQMAELGLERLDIMAWVGLQHDNLDPKYVAFWKDIVDYAKARNIIVGGYELQVASRSRGNDVNCIHPETGKPGSLFGQSVCVASSWKDTYFPKMWKFFDETGIRSFNMDGPYHGDVCAATNHPHHRGLNDSQWEQWKTYVEVLHELQRRNIFIPIPDWYFMNGQCATGMGYREASANLTPQQQMLLGRQYIYDGTWHKLPTMGWMTLQLVGFYTNDPRVGLEPLEKNLDRYEQQLIQYLASGCMLTIRGNRLYDSPKTKQMVKKWIDWYKEHRPILSSEIIHVSRPTGRDLDCIMHVNPFLEEKGMVVVFNPTNRAITKTITLPLYYTGLKGQATVVNAAGQSQKLPMNDKQEIYLKVSIPPQGTSWFVIK